MNEVYAANNINEARFRAQELADQTNTKVALYFKTGRDGSDAWFAIPAKDYVPSLTNHVKVFYIHPKGQAS